MWRIANCYCCRANKTDGGQLCWCYSIYKSTILSIWDGMKWSQGKSWYHCLWNLKSFICQLLRQNLSDGVLKCPQTIHPLLYLCLKPLPDCQCCSLVSPLTHDLLPVLPIATQTITFGSINKTSSEIAVEMLILELLLSYRHFLSQLLFLLQFLLQWCR